ncbi:mechanosensitive ion channel domain-containing protein [Aliiroseovarius lamellibrachiae]|uniref:mechanosensitive ion channel domain-containing protein n=1 Tax=Aliiroseovarius lamellibrachiae TaxID=1924933 RepID=UPI001BDF87D6|nr:mechanosensitive ion channel domain-containing protein [Aliiroseovarius lamellibrachiae]MBT2129934.1 mechanosensitive ion channel family protein [Aliiroseovarius lamellibrachiae]
MPALRLLVSTVFFATLLSISFMAPVVAQDGAISTETGAAQVELDAAIAIKIRDILTELQAYQDVTVTVNEGIVTLRGTTLDATGHDDLQQLVQRVEGVIAIENQVGVSTNLTERLSPAMERFMARLTQVIAFLPLVAIGAVAFVVVAGLGFGIARLRQPWDRLAPNAFIADIYRTVIRIAAVIGGIVVALDILGATALLSTVLGAAGIIGLALGFAVRDTVENFIASLLLSIRQPFRPNDTIEINGDVGKVIRLTSRATILLSFDGNHIRIPNATVFKSRIINYTRNRERRFGFDIFLRETTNLPQALEEGRAQLTALPFILGTPAPAAWIDRVTETGARLSFTAWIDQRDTGLSNARGEAMRVVVAALTDKGATPIHAPETPQSADEAALDQLVAQDREENRQNDLLNAASADE